MANNSEPTPLTLEWLTPSGHAGGRVRGQTVVIPGALPGDRVSWHPTEKRGRSQFGQLETLLEPSPHRTTPPCPWNNSCGGCDLAHLKREERGVLLSKVAGRTLNFNGNVGWLSSPRSDHHRARIKLGLDGATVGYRQEKSHQLADIEKCGIARPEVNEGLLKLRQIVTSLPDHGLNEVEIRSDGQKVTFDFWTKNRITAQDMAPFSSLEHISLNGKPIIGDPTLDLQIGALSLRVSAGVFYQVNLEVNASLVEFVVQAAAHAQPSRVLDLFSGMGNFGLQLAHKGIDVIAVEQPGRAIEDCRHSASRYQLEHHIQVMGLNAKKFDPTRTFFDVAIVDPPRMGTMGCLGKLLLNRPTDIFYVSCHLSSASREIREAIKSGYAIQTVQCFDMFPDTHHFETVIHLKRS